MQDIQPTEIKHVADIPKSEIAQCQQESSKKMASEAYDQPSLAKSQLPGDSNGTKSSQVGDSSSCTTALVKMPKDENLYKLPICEIK
jgi:hypothetical protein